MNIVLFALSADVLSLLTLDFAKVDWQATYLLCSIGVALLVIYEALMLYKTNGKLAEDSWVQSVTLLDIIWLIVSAVALYYVNFSPFAKIIPTIFIIYNVFGWGYSIYLLKDEIDEASLDDLENLIIPKPYIDYSMAFGVVSTVAIGATLFYLYTQQLLVISAVL